MFRRMGPINVKTDLVRQNIIGVEDGVKTRGSVRGKVEFESVRAYGACDFVRPDSFGSNRNGRVELIAGMSTHVNQDLVTRCEGAADSLEIRAVRRLVFFLGGRGGICGTSHVEGVAGRRQNLRRRAQRDLGT